ncbi:UbiA family prenyltransferase [Catellatospora bangladeshensis]|uniref:UbiA family prenyltransferase n=1 Tax=Catellatospora bangladeshensis TaxID=310355 RepID=UPI00361F7285
MSAESSSLTIQARLAAWRYAFITTNPPEQGVVDQVTRWLVVTRAGVLPMTLTSGLLAVLLAAIAETAVDWLNVALAVAGIVVAHLANNLMNDLADTQTGNDTEDYPRALYAPHPILAGLVTKRQLVAGILLCQVVDLVIMAVLVARQDWWIVAFALGGLFLSWAYTAPPLRLKRIGLGELDVLLTWGPLMVGGVYYAGTGTLPWQVLAAATVYALLPTTVLMAKHIDKLPYDGPAGTRTLPVLLGEHAAKRLTQAMMIAFYAGWPCSWRCGRCRGPRCWSCSRCRCWSRSCARSGSRCRPNRRRRTRCGRCGGRRSRSCTPAAPAGCCWGPARLGGVAGGALTQRRLCGTSPPRSDRPPISSRASRHSPTASRAVSSAVRIAAIGDIRGRLIPALPGRGATNPAHGSQTPRRAPPRTAYSCETARCFGLSRNSGPCLVQGQDAACRALR